MILNSETMEKLTTELATLNEKAQEENWSERHHGSEIEKLFEKYEAETKEQKATLTVAIRTYALLGIV